MFVIFRNNSSNSNILFERYYIVLFEKCDGCHRNIQDNVMFPYSQSSQILPTYAILHFVEPTFFFFFFCFLGPKKCSLARGQIRATAAGLCHSPSNARSKRICELHHSSQQLWILNPLSEKARDQTWASSWILVRLIIAKPQWELPEPSFL